jgi:hypothetical protein
VIPLFIEPDESFVSLNSGIVFEIVYDTEEELFFYFLDFGIEPISLSKHFVTEIFKVGSR